EDLAGERDVRLSHLWIIDWERLVGNAAARAGELDDELRELQHGHLVRVADVTRRRVVAPQQAQNPLDEIAHVTETARLTTVAVDGQVLTAQRLRDEIRHDSPVLLPH